MNYTGKTERKKQTRRTRYQMTKRQTATSEDSADIHTVTSWQATRSNRLTTDTAQRHVTSDTVTPLKILLCAYCKVQLVSEYPQLKELGMILLVICSVNALLLNGANNHRIVDPTVNFLKNLVCCVHNITELQQWGISHTSVTTSNIQSRIKKSQVVINQYW